MKHELIRFKNSWDISSLEKIYMVATVYLQIFHLLCSPKIPKTWTKKEVKGEMPAPSSLGYSYIVGVVRNIKKSSFVENFI